MRRGFTLIELLVVMAIISILASILFPVFSKAMDKARQTQCLSNVDQIQMAALMYASDYDGCYPPPAYVPPGGSGAPVTWATAPAGYKPMLLPYTENAQILVCPALPGVPVGYALNWWMAGPNGANAQKSAQKITFGDAATVAANYAQQWYMYPIGQSDPGSGTGVNPFPRHNNGENFAYADGHAKWSPGTTADSASAFAANWDPNQ